MQAQSFNTDNPLIHTYSIVARDSVTGEIGIAVQSHWFSVGNTVSWAKAGVGGIATQSFANLSFGPKGLSLLEQGRSAMEVLGRLISEDEGRDYRQVAVVDASGEVAVYTGSKCIRYAGHHQGKGYSVQANMMLSEEVWPAMAQAYETTPGPLEEKMMAALEAAEAVGGDIRGRQSASMLIVRSTSGGKVWEDRRLDLRVDDHPEPLKELRRLINVHGAYQFMNQGDHFLEKGMLKEAFESYDSAYAIYPENTEIRFWAAIAHLNAGNLESAREMLSDIFLEEPNWKMLLLRLEGTELIKAGSEQMDLILGR